TRRRQPRWASPSAQPSWASCRSCRSGRSRPTRRRGGLATGRLREIPPSKLLEGRRVVDELSRLGAGRTDVAVGQVHGHRVPPRGSLLGWTHRAHHRDPPASVGPPSRATGPHDALTDRPVAGTITLGDGSSVFGAHPAEHPAG